MKKFDKNFSTSKRIETFPSENAEYKCTPLPTFCNHFKFQSWILFAVDAIWK